MFIKTTLKDGRITYTKPRGFHMSEAELLSVCRNSEKHYYKGAKTEIVSRVPNDEKALDMYFEDSDWERFGNSRDVARTKKEMREIEKRTEKERKKSANQFVGKRAEAKKPTIKKPKKKK